MANVTVTGTRAAALGGARTTGYTVLFDDQFPGSSLDAQWTNPTLGTGVTITVSGGMLNIALPVYASGSRYGIIQSTSTIDLTGATVATRFTTAAAETGADVAMQLYKDASNYLQFGSYGLGVLQAWKTVAGVSTEIGTSGTTPAFTHLRIRESGGTVYWEYSLDWGLTWVTHTSQTVASLFAVTAVYVRLAAGDNSGGSSGSFIASFDYVKATKSPSVNEAGLLTAFRGAVGGAGSGVITAGVGGVTSAAGRVGLTGMYSGWSGPGVNAPFVVGVTAAATATASPGTGAINAVTTQNAVIEGALATAAASADPGEVTTVARSNASLVVEVDFSGNPTAPFFDQASQTAGVGAYWRMDNDIALTDIVAGSDGDVTAAPTLITGALAYDTNDALRFNGTTQYARVPSNTTLTPAGSYTLAGWFRFPTLPSAVKPIVTKGSYRLKMNASNKLVWSVTNDQSGVLTNTSVTSHSALDANTWYFVAGVHDAENDELRLYVNGVLDDSAAHTVGTEVYQYPLMFAGLPNLTAPAYRASSGTGNPAGFTQSVFTVAVPTFVSGDLMIAQLSATGSGSSETLTAPAGWTLLTQTISGSYKQWIYYKYAAATEPTSFSWTYATPTTWGGAISTWSGVDATYPFASPPYAFFSVTTASHLVTADNTLAVAIFGQVSNTTIAGWTQRYFSSGTGGDAPISLYSKTPSFEETVVGTSTDAHHAHLLILNGTGVGTFTAVDLDEWFFATAAVTDEQAAEMYDSRLSGVATWTDVSADARSASVSYGRQYELNRMESGHADVTLKNQHRRYDPANTSSIYAPNVKPNRKIRMRALLNGVYYPLWEGLVERWPSDWGISPNYDEVKLTIADGFKALNRAGVSSVMGAGLSGAQITTALARALWPVDKRELDTGEFIMSAQTTVQTTAALGVIQDVADSELGIFFINHVVDGSPATFHDRSRRWTNSRSVTSQVTFSDQPGTIRYHDLVPSDDDDSMVNEWTVTSADGTAATAVDATSRQENFPVTSERSTRLDNPDDATVQARALLRSTARPALRFDQLTVRLTRETAITTWQTLLALAISDRVTVIRNPVPGAGGSTITRSCFIEGIGWQITPNYWDVSFQLSPVTSLPFFDTAVVFDPVSYWRFDEVT